MLKLCLVATIVSVGLTVTGTGAVCAQDFPSRPIRIISSPPGGAPDQIARLIAHGFGESFGWHAVVDNRPSGFGQGELLARATPDGYTIQVVAGSFTIGPLLEKAPYDVVKDFAPITLVITTPTVLVVHLSLPVKSVNDLIALAKAKPGQLNFATSGTGSGNHMPAELFKILAGVNMTRINYKGGGPATLAVISGESDMIFGSAPSVAPHIKSGKLRALGVSTAKPTALLPGMPTVAASLPGFEFIITIGILAPTRTPPAVINRLNQAIVRVINQPDNKQKLFNDGAEVVGNTPEEYAAIIKSDLAIMGKVIKQAGIRAD